MGWEFKNPFKKDKAVPVAEQKKRPAEAKPEATAVSDPGNDLGEMRANAEANDAEALAAVRKELAAGKAETSKDVKATAEEIVLEALERGERSEEERKASETELIDNLSQFGGEYGPDLRQAIFAELLSNSSFAAKRILEQSFQGLIDSQGKDNEGKIKIGMAFMERNTYAKEMFLNLVGIALKSGRENILLNLLSNSGMSEESQKEFAKRFVDEIAKLGKPYGDVTQALGKLDFMKNSSVAGEVVNHFVKMYPSSDAETDKIFADQLMEQFSR